jgi:predicted MPP superfamily phosphohydrolase
MVYLIPGLLFQFTENENVKLIGWLFSGLLFLGILVGILYGRWNWKTHRIQLSFPHFPDELESLKIVQISDIHVGSFFNNHAKVERAIDMINSLEADYVFFTGDLVNNTASEMDGWEPVFSRIHAKKGKYSILGNHDYGDYVRWEHDSHKVENLQRLIEKHREIGFTPLLNESVQLERDIWLLGVENWGKAPFRQSGKLAETLNDVPESALKILLSHDPSHFDLQVLETNIDLTLSGHTHGMQFGIERFGIKWSPVSFRYKKWAGLYKEGKQYLYVNRGFGYLGFPGRVGIYPEITEITITKE